MPVTPPLSLSDIVDITVSVAPTAASANPFNQGLFIGQSTVIPSYGANSRLRQYAASTYATAMLTDGFTATSPEYLAAQIYFSQSPQPSYIWIGRQDLTAIQTAVPDGRTVNDGDITTGTDTLTSATASFVAGDVGAQVIVVGAGVSGGDLVTTIASVTSGTAVVLTASAGTTVVNAQTLIGAYGQNYVANDVVTVVEIGASNGQLTVLTVGPSGAALTLGVVPGTQGTGYTVSTNLSTTGGTGTGLNVNITAVGETLLQSAQACRAVNSTWYGLSVYNPVDADNLALAGWASPLWQTTKYYPWSADSQIPAGAAGNLFLQLQTLKYRCEAIYSTTQSGLYPNNIYAAAGLMGVEMGLNTGLANSFFSSAHKSIVGIAYEPLTETQYTAIKSAGGNVLADFGGQYTMLEPGQTSDGNDSTFWLFIASLVANIQIDTVTYMRSVPVVAQTNTAQQQLIHNGPDQACALLASIGFIAPGTWTGVTFPVPTAANPALQTGQSLPSGYVSFSAPYSNPKPVGQAMPIYTCIITAGAVKTVAIGVNVQL